MLEVHEAVQRAATNELTANALPMFPDATDEVAGHADVERAVASVRHDIDPAAHARREWMRSVKKTWMAGTSPAMTGEAGRVTVRDSDHA